MRNTRISNLLFVAIMALAVTVSAMAQAPQPADNATQAQNNASQSAAQPARVAVGRKQKLNGVIVSREADKIIMRDLTGVDIVVNVTSSTKITEKKSNPFRGAKNYPVTALLRGLEIEVEGRGSDGGTLVADRVKFTDNDFGVARSIESRVTPVETRVTTTEGRVDTAETRISAAEQNAQRLSGQLEELAAVANTARGGAKAAQETADNALAAAKAASADVQATNDRISQIDNYEAKQNITVNFKVNSAVLSDDAKAALDEIAQQAKNEKGYLIQVTGYASADGSEAKNRALSERRADAVRRYLAENHDIPLHRMINPFGFGELKPVAENDTRDGRKQNRRVEVAILVNKGLTTPISATAQSSRN
ncbi:MAG TPA: OmpA family protein [Blastocatellia bacterium]|nr:OmpA family protein [Blastocatellia bacterium]